MRSELKLDKSSENFLEQYQNADKTLCYITEKESIIKIVPIETAINTKTDIYEKSGKKILTLNGFQKICDKEGIVEKAFQMLVSPSESNLQQHSVNITLGYAGDTNTDNWKRATGEASKLNTGKMILDTKGEIIYKELDQIDAKYRMAMAEKRAFVRAVQKLIKLYGIMGDVETPDFARDGTEVEIKNFDY